MDQRTIDTYNKMAKQYDDETTDFWDNFPESFIDRFVELSGDKIINIGSGPGRDALLIKNKGKQVVCVDASDEMVKLSSEKGLESVLSDFNNIPFDNDSFDGVWSYTALLHIPKKLIDIPLKEINRILKHSGIFALGLIEGDTEEYKESSGISLPRLFSFYKKDEVIDICKRHGFELVHFEVYKPRSKSYINFIFRKL